jgi:hypothetical protein
MEKATISSTGKQVWQSQGIRGFYQGAVPMFIGSIMYRSLQFAVFDACYTKYKDNSFWNQPIVLGVQRWVVLAGVVGGVCRAVLECPFEYTKVRRQTNLNW